MNNLNKGDAVKAKLNGSEERGIEPREVEGVICATQRQKSGELIYQIQFNDTDEKCFCTESQLTKQASKKGD